MNMEFSVAAWSRWHDASDDATPALDVSAIPGMLRRRLNTLGRACASQALPFLEKYQDVPLVYCSQHGDIERTLRILLELADTGEVSPKDFSLAVHNAICGVLSIHAGVRGSISTIAAGDQYQVPLLLEAIGLLHEHPRVLCVVCDVPLPTIYRDADSTPERAFAEAFLLERAGASRLALSWTAGAPAATPATGICATLLAASDAAQTLTHNGSSWQLASC